MVNVNFEFDCSEMEYKYIDNYIQRLLSIYHKKRNILSNKEAIIDAISNLSDYKHVYKVYDNFVTNNCLSMCNICLQESKECVKTKCKHTFHKKCITKWFKMNPRCPCCRKLLI